MTIKQQGGIFGRNPTFNNVTVDGTLTADGSLTGNVVNAAGADGAAAINIKEGASVRGTIGHTSDDLFIANASCGLYFDNSNDRLLPYNFTTNSLPIGTIALGQSTYRFKELYLSENVYVGAGYGIDFSATSGTGTSELFDDYEEGIFTPTLTTSGTDFSSVTYDGFTGGKYVKVGNLVTVYGTVRTDAVTIGSASGAVCIGGLPFTSAAQTGATRDGSCPASISDATTWGADVPCVGQGSPSSTVLLLYKRASITGDMAIVVPADVATGANSNRIAFSMTYVAA